jgi:hypothetical protein
MAEPTLLGDLIQPAWQLLTPEQRTCWHFWAAAHPQLDEQARLRTLYGQQAHYARNASIAVSEAVPYLNNPPPNTDPPKQVLVFTMAWPIQSRLMGGTTARQGFVFLRLANPMPADAVAIVTQGYDKKKRPRGRPPRVRHVTVIVPLQGGEVFIDLPDGYYATTSGDNRFARILGVTARRRPDLALGKMRVVNITNGQTIRQILANPYGGARKKNNRARATSVKPLTGTNHYP